MRDPAQPYLPSLRISVDELQVWIKKLQPDLEYWSPVLAQCNPERFLLDQDRIPGAVALPSTVQVPPASCDFSQGWQRMSSAWFYGAGSVPVQEGTSDQLALCMRGLKPPVCWVVKVLKNGELEEHEEGSFEAVLEQVKTVEIRANDDWIGVCVEWEEPATADEA